MTNVRGRHDQFLNVQLTVMFLSLKFQSGLIVLMKRMRQHFLNLTIGFLDLSIFVMILAVFHHHRTMICKLAFQIHTYACYPSWRSIGRPPTFSIQLCPVQSFPVVSGCYSSY
ncbi:unnamed protein product [Schistosoma curassoni]|uniref:Secreted protein n=1 Tax=Schistosoma curassoni TaxID=6186 RepID=A0A183JKP1_9TREM|nr:unnamed protein product [Schistosoma curassoni]